MNGMGAALSVKFGGPLSSLLNQNLTACRLLLCELLGREAPPGRVQPEERGPAGGAGTSRHWHMHTHCRGPTRSRCWRGLLLIACSLFTASVSVSPAAQRASYTAVAISAGLLVQQGTPLLPSRRLLDEDSPSAGS